MHLKILPRLVYLNFVAYLASCVTPFLLMFQSSQPLVHVLYQKTNELVRQCMCLFMKPDVVAEKEGHNLSEVNCEQSRNWLESGKMAIGSGTKHALKVCLVYSVVSARKFFWQ